MDKTTLKSIIVTLRDEDIDNPKSFAAIAKILKDDYGIEKDRQSIYGIYTRAKKDEEEEIKKYNIQAVADVVNLLALGYNKSETRNIASSIGEGVSYYSVREIADNEENYIKSVQEEQVRRISIALSKKTDIDKAKSELSYKGIWIKDKRWEDLIAEAYYRYIENMMQIELAVLYKDYGLETLRKVIEKIGVDIPINWVKARSKELWYKDKDRAIYNIRSDYAK